MHHPKALPSALTRALEYTEAAAWAQFYRPSASPRSKLAIIANATAATVPEVDSLVLNRVIGLGLTPATSPKDVDRTISFYRRAEASRFLVQHSPLGSIALPSWLRSRGFRLHNHSAKLVCTQPTNYQAPATGLRVARIDASRAVVYGNILCAGFGWQVANLNKWLAGPIGRPNYYHYLVFLGKLPIAAGAMYVAGRYAEFVISATRPDFQGRGAQALLIQTQLAEAKALGCTYFIAETAAPKPPAQKTASQRNLERFGFREVYQRQHYLYSF